MSLFLLLLGLLAGWVCYQVFIAPKFNPLQQIAGPPYVWKGDVKINDPSYSSKVYDIYVQKYGRSMRIWGLMPGDIRFLTLDPWSVRHILTNPTIYEKPFQIRDHISNFLGNGLISAEGQIYKHQRRVIAPTFSRQYVRGLLPLFFNKGNQLKEKWMGLVCEGARTYEKHATVDVYGELKWAALEVMGHAALDCDLNANHDELNELLLMQRDLWDLAILPSSIWGGLVTLYCPWMTKVIPNKHQKSIERYQSTIRHITDRLVREKKRKIEDTAANGKTYESNDFLSRLLKFNAAKDLAPEDRLSDDDIFHNINTFLFAGTDTTSVGLTWTLYLLSQNPDLQTRLRNELLSVVPAVSISKLTEEEIHSLSGSISNLSYFHNVIRESLRLFPPAHSFLRVTTKDDQVPTIYPVYDRHGNIMEGEKSVTVPKGTLVQVAIEGFNLDKGLWGEDAWEFNPDRWDGLPEKVQALPGLLPHTLSFSTGPRACMGMHFSMAEMRTILYILLTHFVFIPTEDKIKRGNIILTYPYISNRPKEGRQLPMIVKPFRKADITERRHSRQVADKQYFCKSFSAASTLTVG